MSAKRSRRPSSKNSKFDVGRSTFDVREARLFSPAARQARTRRWRDAFRRVWPLTTDHRSRIADFFKKLLAQPKKSRRRNPVLAFHRNAALEPLEQRQLLAALLDGGGTTLDIELAANEALSVVSNGTTYQLTSNQTFLNSGVADTGDFSPFGSTLLTLQGSGLTRYDTINIVDAPGATQARVTFNDSGANAYSDNISVVLNEPFPSGPPNFFHPLWFYGATSFSGANSLSASSNMRIEVNPGASITTTAGDITLVANQQASATVGNAWTGVKITDATIGSTTGDITLEGRGGVISSNNYGVWLASNAVVGAGTTGLVTVQGTGSQGAGSSHGVRVTASQITSGGGNVMVVGHGGGGGNSVGVAMDGNGEITAGGSGIVTVEGTGGDNGVGVSANQATITSNGGEVTVRGTGGDNGGSNHGIQFSGTITAGGSGNVHVTGTGGNSDGYSNIGVFMPSGARVSSNGGDVFVDGTGGGTTVSPGANWGVQLFPNGVIKPGGNGNATVVGTGGAGSQSDGVYVAAASPVESAGITSSGGNVTVRGTAIAIGYGVFLNGSVRPSQGGDPEISAGGSGNITIEGTSQGQGAGVAAISWSEITSSGGDISIEGTGGSTGDLNYGVVVSGAGAGSGFTALVSAGAGGSISIVGTGGNSGGQLNDGVRIGGSPFGNNAEIRTDGGDITVTGIAGTGTFQTGIGVTGGGRYGLIATSNSGNISLIADAMDVSGPVSAQTRTVMVQPKKTDGSIGIDLGVADSTTALGLYNSESAQVTAGSLIIGAATNGPISPLGVGVDATATSLVLGSDLSIEINGLTVDTQYDQLNVVGAADLNNTDLALSGGFTSSAGQVFTIVSATSVTGEFNGLSNNATVVLNSRSLRVNYTATTVTLTDVGPSNTAPVARDDDVTTNEDTSFLIDVLADNGNGVDFDADGNIDASLTAVLSPPSAGVLTNHNDGTFTFDPNGEFESLAVGQPDTVTFDYQIQDTFGEVDAATVTITITGRDDAPELTGGGTAVTYTEDNPAEPVDPNLSLTDPDTGATLDGATVTITGNLLASQDELVFTDQNGITGSYNAASGVLILTGTASVTDYETALQSVAYRNTSQDPNASPRTVTFTLSTALANPDNEHFYQFVSAPAIRWDDARDAADNLTFFGLQGYLATITSAEENAFAASKLQGVGWIGANDVANEGDWWWVTGPEAGTQFWLGGPGGSTVGGQYANWNGGEPNDCCAGEDYAHMIFNTAIGPLGSWNDLPVFVGSGAYVPQGFVVEYGGLPGDSIVSLSSSNNVNVVPVNDAPVANDDEYTVSEDEVLSITATGLTNVALNPSAVATQSTTGAGGLPERAIDGNTDGIFSNGSVTHTANVANNYWEVSLGDDHGVQQIVLHNRADCCGSRLSNFRVSVFDDAAEVFGQNFFVGSGSVAQGGQLAVTVPSGAIGDRVCVQLLGTNNDGNGILSLAEVEVFAADGVLGNDTDVDDPNSAFTVTTPGTYVGNYGTLVLSTDGSLTYTVDGNHPAVDELNVGDTLTDSFPYSMSDNHPGDPLGDSSQITFVIQGVNDGPVATDNAAAVQEDVTLSDGGNVITDDDGFGVDRDVDNAQNTLSVSEVDGVAGNVGSPVAGSYGSVTINSDGTYSYTLDNGAANVQALADGETVSDSYDYTLMDPVLTGDGLISVQVVNTSGPNPGVVLANWLNLWNALDNGDGPTGVVAGYNVDNNTSDAETVFDYAGGGGNFPVNNTIGTIAGDGPGGGPGPFNPSGTSGVNYSIRGRAFLMFNSGGTYTIAMGSDDGRQISLTEATPGSAPGYAGFTSQGDQVNGTFTPGDTVIGYTGGTGHNQSVGVFSVAAGDILELDAFYYEGGGGDSGEISIASGSYSAFTSPADFQLLQDGALGGAVLLDSTGAFSGLTDSATLEVTITGTNDNPTADDATFSLPENTDNGTSVGSVTSGDIDNGDSVVSYDIISGNTASAFAIDNGGLITVNNKAALDFETNPTFNLVVEVEDTLGATGTSNVTINLTDLQATVSIDDDSVVEGDSGPAALGFTVSLSGDMVNVPFGVSYATADDSATLADNDYVQIVGGSVPFMGTVAAETQPIAATANGDTQVELDEQFFINLTGITGTNDVTIAGGSLLTVTQTGADLFNNPVVSFPDSQPILDGNVLRFPDPLTRRIELDWDLLPAQARQDLDIRISVTYTPLSGDNDIQFGIGDGNNFQGILRADNGGGSFWSVDSTHDQTLTSFEIQQISGGGLNPVETFAFTLSIPDGGQGPTVLSDIVESGFALPGPFYLSDHPIDTDQALSLLVAADSNNLAPFEIHAISIEIEGNAGGGAAAVGTILNDDYATLSIGDATVTEGGDLVFNATLTNPVDVDTVITYSTADGSATTADSDYAGQTAQTLTIPAGQTSGTITVATTADNQVELDETLDVNLTAVSAGGRAVSILDGTGEGTIENDDSATLSIADTMVFEGDAGDSNQLVFNLTLDNPVDVPISVDYRTENGTATTADSDYAGIGITSLSIAAGDTSAQIVVDVTGDGKVEYDETLQMVLDNLNALGRDVSLAGTGTTSNPLELLDFSAAAGTLPDGTTYTVSGSYQPAANGLRVNAYQGLPTATVTFSRPVFFQVLPANATGHNDPPTDILAIDAVGGLLTVTADPDDELATVTGDGTANMVVEYRYRGDGAGGTSPGPNGNDYQSINQDWIIDGFTTSTLSLTDTDASGNSWIFLAVASAGANGVTATGTIKNDDTATLSIDDVSNPEDGTFTFTITSDKFASEDLTVVVNTADIPGQATAGSDYTAIVGQTVTILAGTTSTTVTVTVNDDAIVENDQTFEVNLSDARFDGATDPNRVVVGDGTGVGTIENNDTATLSIADASVLEGSGGTTDLVFTITSTNPSEANLTVQVDTAEILGQAAGGGVDFTDLAGVVATIPGDSVTTFITVAVPVNPDYAVEPDETLEVNLSAPKYDGVADPTRAVLGDSNAIGTILNDDQENSVVVGACPCGGDLEDTLALYVNGSSLDDKIDVKLGSMGSMGGVFKIKIKTGSMAGSGMSMGTFKFEQTVSPADSDAVISKIVIYGLDGNDDIKIHGDIEGLRGFLFGGAGDDKIMGGKSDDVLVGGPGDDKLDGHQGRDIVIGGTGADKIMGNKDEDILIAGATDYDDNLTALCAIMDEWTRTDNTFEDRVNNLFNGSGAGGALNGTYTLENHVQLSDGAKDDLKGGGSGTDWFILSEADGDKADKLHDGEAFWSDVEALFFES